LFSEYPEKQSFSLVLETFGFQDPKNSKNFCWFRKAFLFFEARKIRGIFLCFKLHLPFSKKSRDFLLKINFYLFALLFFSFFILLRCHFQRICLFFFHLLELLFILTPSIHFIICSRRDFQCKDIPLTSLNPGLRIENPK